MTLAVDPTKPIEVTLTFTIFDVRTGLGTVDGTGFTDTICEAKRAVRNHGRYYSVRYKGKRYQLFGGIRTNRFICLNNPLKYVA